MFRLLFLFAFLAVGFAAGIAYDRSLMRGECKAGEGQWTGTICVGSELLQ
jgi:hypothetical protein